MIVNLSIVVFERYEDLLVRMMTWFSVGQCGHLFSAATGIIPEFLHVLL
jgi:hypothetical protein